MTMRSALPKENGQLTMGCAVTRLVSLPRRPRARNTDNRVPSATETRAIEALAPSRAGVRSPAGRNIAKGAAAANRHNPFKSFADGRRRSRRGRPCARSEEHTSELQSLRHLVCRLLLEKKKHNNQIN